MLGGRMDDGRSLVRRGCAGGAMGARWGSDGCISRNERVR